MPTVFQPSFSQTLASLGLIKKASMGVLVGAKARMVLKIDRRNPFPAKNSTNRCGSLLTPRIPPGTLYTSRVPSRTSRTQASPPIDSR